MAYDLFPLVIKDSDIPLLSDEDLKDRIKMSEELLGLEELIRDDLKEKYSKFWAEHARRQARRIA